MYRSTSGSSGDRFRLPEPVNVLAERVRSAEADRIWAITKQTARLQRAHEASLKCGHALRIIRPRLRTHASAKSATTFCASSFSSA